VRKNAADLKKYLPHSRECSYEKFMADEQQDPKERKTLDDRAKMTGLERIRHSSASDGFEKLVFARRRHACGAQFALSQSRRRIAIAMPIPPAFAA